MLAPTPIHPYRTATTMTRRILGQLSSRICDFITSFASHYRAYPPSSDLEETNLSVEVYVILLSLRIDNLVRLTSPFDIFVLSLEILIFVFRSWLFCMLIVIRRLTDFLIFRERNLLFINKIVICQTKF